MSIFSSFVKGFVSVITITASPQLYRYSYRSSSEGLRGDMQKIGEDMEAAIERLPSRERE